MPSRSRQRPWRDQLPGGLADEYTPADFDPDALARGIKVELEHTDDVDLATEIAMDHLVEQPGGPGKLDYYEALATIDPHHNPGYGPVRAGRIPTWVKPPKSAQRIAAKALERREALPPSRRGGLTKSQAKQMSITSGVERAKSIARGDYQPAEDINAFFQRFKGTYQSAIMRGKPWRDSKVQQAWDLWGGATMWKAAQKALKKPSKTKRIKISGLMRKALK